MVARDFDIIVMGATGYTGQLVVDYISKTYPTGLKWAIVGRDGEKLKSLHKSLNLSESTKIVIADSSGTPVIDACVRCGTHYCDITGEGPWVRNVIDQYHTIAVEKKLKIVNCCGFDCIPADIGTMMIVNEMEEQKVVPTEVRYIAKKIKGGISGGTISSVLNIFSGMTMKKALESADPFSLAPRDEATGIPLRATDPKVVALNHDSYTFTYDKVVGYWMMPWVMQSIDTRIVNRSNALSGWRYGRNLIYREYSQAPNVAVAMFVSALFPMVGALLYFSLTRNIIKRLVPQQGQGPSQEMLDTGYLQIGFWGRGTGAGGEEVVVKGGVYALHGDPGYRQTAKFIAESGVALALDTDALPPMYGVLTPSTALGTVLMDRLKAKGVDFYIGEHKA